METCNHDGLIHVNKKEDVEYYSISAMDHYGDFEHFIITKNFDVEHVSDTLGLNHHKMIAIEKFDLEGEEIYFAKDVDIKAYMPVVEDVFAIVTNMKRTPLMTKTQNNYIQVMIYDPDKSLAALAAIDMHQTLNKSLKKLVLEMNLKFNSNPMDLKVNILALADVKKVISDETAEIFKNNFHNIGHCITHDHEGNTQVDLAKISIATLLEVGIKYENIALIKNKSFPIEVEDDNYIDIIVNMK